MLNNIIYFVEGLTKDPIYAGAMIVVLIIALVSFISIFFPSSDVRNDSK